MDAHSQNVIFSNKNDDWGTPPELYLKLHNRFKFSFDPCPLSPTFDGLKENWMGSIFVNPPYSNIVAFLEKGQAELNKGNARVVVFLIPARIDTKWYHQYVDEQATVIPLKGRVKFENGNKHNNSAPFPSIICVFPPMSAEETKELKAELNKKHNVSKEAHKPNFQPQLVATDEYMKDVSHIVAFRTNDKTLHDLKKTIGSKNISLCIRKAIEYYIQTRGR